VVIRYKNIPTIQQTATHNTRVTKHNTIQQHITNRNTTHHNISYHNKQQQHTTTRYKAHHTLNTMQLAICNNNEPHQRITHNTNTLMNRR